MGFYYKMDGFPSGHDPVPAHSQFIKQCRCAFTCDLIIINNQYRQPGQFITIFLFFQTEFKGDGDRKSAAFAQLTLYINGTVHHSDDILRNGHAQTCSLQFADAGIFCPGKRFKYTGYEFLGYSYAAVDTDKFILAFAGRR